MRRVERCARVLRRSIKIEPFAAPKRRVLGTLKKEPYNLFDRYKRNRLGSLLNF